KLGFEDISNWADELGPVSRKPLPSQSFEEGNLAALEETDPKLQPPKVSPDVLEAEPAAPLEPVIAALAKAPAPAPPAKSPPKAAPESAPVVSPPPKKGSTAVVALLVLVALAAGIWVGLHK